MRDAQTQDTTKTGVIVRVLRELLRTSTFDSHADLKDALWRRLHQLRIRVTAAEVDEALTVVGSNTVLIRSATSAPPQTPTPEADTLGRDEARQLLAQLKAPAVRQMPKVARVSPRVADTRKAFEMVLRQIEATVAQCDALEANGSATRVTGTRR